MKWFLSQFEIDNFDDLVMSVADTLALAIFGALFWLIGRLLKQGV